MPRIRVLIVDDSAVIRRMLSDALSHDPMLEVVGTAPNGRIALAKIPQVQPQVVILDVDMPEISGLETLAVIRRTDPRLPVIIFSALTERGAAVTLEALSMGASDYVTKPSSLGGSAAAEEKILGELIPRIKAVCSAARSPGVAARVSKDSAHQPLPRRARPRSPSRVEVVAIGASTGGPAVLCELLPRLPADFSVPILIAQHMPPIFTRLLSERLDSISALRVLEGVSDSALRAGTVWIAPGDRHMVVERRGNVVSTRTHKEPPRHSCRPSVDVLLESIAVAFGPGALVVVLTGMGQDGLDGCGRIRDAGGQIIVQDELSSVVWGMPGAVAKAGLADDVVARDQLASEILQRVGAGSTLRRASQASVPEEHE